MIFIYGAFFFESSMVHCSMDDMTTLQMIGSIECTMIAS